MFGYLQQSFFEFCGVPDNNAPVEHYFNGKGSIDHGFSERGRNWDVNVIKTFLVIGIDLLKPELKRKLEILRLGPTLDNV